MGWLVSPLPAVGIEHQPVLARIDVPPALVVALEVQPTGRDDAEQALQRAERHARLGDARQTGALAALEVALVAGRQAVAGGRHRLAQRDGVRLGHEDRVVTPRLRERGWHSPGVAGPVGAAAAVARLLRLDAGGMQSAMGHGAAQGAGTFAGLGTEAVKFNQARGATAGLLAGLAAKSGLAASPLWLTSEDGGMAHAYVDGGAPDALVRDLGTHWELEQISLRRWPAASSVQSLIEVCLEIDVPVEDVAGLAIELSPRAYEVSGDRGWESTLAAQQSARWVAACTLLDGDWWLEHSDPERLGDPRVTAVAERITVTSSPTVGGGGVRVHLRRTNGEELLVERAGAPGDPDRPLSRADVQAKLSRASTLVVPA